MISNKETITESTSKTKASKKADEWKRVLKQSSLIFLNGAITAAGIYAFNAVVRSAGTMKGGAGDNVVQSIESLFDKSMVPKEGDLSLGGING